MQREHLYKASRPFSFFFFSTFSYHSSVPICPISRSFSRLFQTLFTMADEVSTDSSSGSDTAVPVGKHKQRQRCDSKSQKKSRTSGYETTQDNSWAPPGPAGENSGENSTSVAVDDPWTTRLLMLTLLQVIVPPRNRDGGFSSAEVRIYPNRWITNSSFGSSERSQSADRVLNGPKQMRF